MKKAFLFLLLITSIYSCQKDNLNGPGEIIIEPPSVVRISKDSIATGQFWGITIGQISAEIYAKIQSLSAEKGITSLGVVDNRFSRLDSIQNMIPLYSSLFLDERKGTDRGIQFSFNNDKVEQIFVNSGQRLQQWPALSNKNLSVAVGDPVSEVYDKLSAIKNTSNYNSLFESLSIFYKIVSKPYDPTMSKSRQWYFATPVVNKRYYLVHLNFVGGKLQSIKSELWETAG